MFSRLISIALIMSCLWSCAPQRQSLHPSTPANAPYSPPPLSEDQILGLKRPPGMIPDPETGEYALPGVMQSYWQLKEKAAQDGWHLILVSGYRSFKSQAGIWNRYNRLYRKTDKLNDKGRVRATMSLVSVPGLSRHHWGTDMDISEQKLRGQLINVQPATPAKVIEFYNWMEHNAPQFGFCKVYWGKRGAVRDEPWHWSYFPYSQHYEEQFMAIKDFSKILDDRVADVKYLASHFKEVITQETRSINTECSLEVQNK